MRSVIIQLKEKLQIRSEIKSFGGKDKSVKTAPSKGLIGGEKQLNFVEGEQVSKIPPELETPVDRMTVNWQEESQAVPQSGSSGNEDMKKFAPQNIQISNKEKENKERWKDIVPEDWEDAFYPFLDVFYKCAVPDC